MGLVPNLISDETLTCVYQDPQKWRRDLAALEKWEAIDHNRTGIMTTALPPGVGRLRR